MEELALLPDEQPSRLESRFKAMLESYQEGRWEKSNLARKRARLLSRCCGA